MNRLEKSWYEKNGLSATLRPFSRIFSTVVFLRRLAYRINIIESKRLKVPVIVVGNLTVGGNGKTPLVIWLACFLKQSGYSPGIISRGYGGKAKHWPQQVRPDGDPVMVGDEAILIARRTHCPMAVGPSRVESARELLKHAKCDIIISDDGLQHYQLKRDVEIVVIDGIRRFGNGYCLPAGPLREPISRLDKVDFVITNGVNSQNELTMDYTGERFFNLYNEEQNRAPNEFKKESIHAVAGIAHPERFFNYLKKLNLDIIEHPFPDHHSFIESDLDFGDSNPLIMTEKDAVKCRRFSKPHFWCLPIEVDIQKEFGLRLLNLLESKHG